MSRPGYVDKRGSNKTRARRRSWLLTEFDADLGPGRARCHLRLSARCERVVDEASLRVDRLDVGGNGSYRRGRIQPSCPPCSDRQGGLAGIATQEELLAEYRAARDQWRIRFDLTTGYTYRPGIIAEARAKSRRGGRNEVTDYVNEHPPPVLGEWLRAWHGARRERVAA
jgi:hypothetical protein